VKRALLLLALVAVLPACVSAKMFRTGSGAMFPPTSPGAVLVYFSAADVPKPYEVIGEIMTEGSSAWVSSDDKLVSKAQRLAAQIGAQGIIVTKEKGASATAGVLLGANDRKQRVQAIRFKE
jgi:hypothetical protein